MTGPEYLAAELERLMSLPLATPTDIEGWYVDCGAVQQILEHQFPDFGFEHEVWHFFNDADIRSRDSGYRDRQHRLMSDYVRRLRTSIGNSSPR